MADAIDNAVNPGPSGAAPPKSVTTQAGTVSARNADELIKLDQYQAAKLAAANGAPFGGIRFGKIIGPNQCPTTPSSVSDPSQGDF